MKSIVRLSLLLMLSTAFFTSCKKGAPKQTRHIPKNAVFVAAINTKAITAKLAKSQVSVENLFKSMDKTDTSMNKAKKEWEEFQNSGIDLSENFYVAVTQKGGGMGSSGTSSVMTGIGGLKDGSKLEAYIKKKNPAAVINKEKDYSYTTMEGNNVVAWGSDLVMVTSTTPAVGQMQFDSITGEYSMKQAPSNEGDLKADIASYFNMKEDESVASIAEFRELMQDNADGSFWINSASSVDNMPIPLPKVKELLANSFTAATLNFDDGEVVVNSKSYSSPALSDLLKKYTGPEVDLGLIEKYPSNNVNGFMSFAFNPELIVGLINYLELKAMADGQLSKILGGNYTVNDVVKAIKGDMAVVVSDFSMPGVDSATGMMKTTSPMKMIMNMPVGDKAQMNRLMDKMVEMGMMVKNGNVYNSTEAISRTGYQVVVDDKNMIMASDAQTLQQYQAGTNKATIASDVMGEFKGKTAAFYMNIESILNGIPSNPNDAQMNTIMPKAKATFKDASAYIDTYNGKYTSGRMELRFKNTKENSLATLVNFFSEAAKTGTFDKKTEVNPTDTMITE